MKKVMVVDDAMMFLEHIVASLQKAGFDACGMMNGVGIIGAKLLPQQAVEGADIIFLDHNMDHWTGAEWLAKWSAVVPFDDKIVIGTSSSPQPYVGHKVRGDAGDIVAKAKELIEKDEKGE